MLFLRQACLWVWINILEEAAAHNGTRQTTLREARVRYNILASQRSHPNDRFSLSVLVLAMLVSVIGFGVMLDGIFLNRDSEAMLGLCVLGCGAALAAMVTIARLLKENR